MTKIEGNVAEIEKTQSQGTAAKNGLDEAKLPELSKQSLDISFSEEVVTPEDAEAMLKTADGPKRDERAVQAYAQSMRNEAWLVNGMPLIFDENGALIDGVQRLYACIEADEPFETAVTRNVRRDTMHTIDQQRSRSYAGVLESRGVENAGALVRMMRKLIKIENGALNRDPLPVGWARYDRVLEKNPELLEAAELSKGYTNHPLHAMPRPTFFFQAIRAGKREQLESFMEEMKPDFDADKITAALQARMRFGAWNADESIKIDTDKILGNVVKFFDAYYEGAKLADNFVWNPDIGKVRNIEGRWLNPERPVRHDRADGLSWKETEEINSDEAIEVERLKVLARRLLRAQQRSRDGVIKAPQLGIPPRLDSDEFKEFLEPVDTLHERLRAEVKRRLIEKAAPPNLGMPTVEGYPGIREAIIDRSRQVEEFVGRISEDIRAGAHRPTDKISTRMIVVTPELAKRWLSKEINSRNRKIQKSHIKAIARDIARERWMVNAQPISFTADPFDPDSEGKLRLLNGQHRLYAVIEADMPIEVPIAVNIPEEAFATFDIHAKRQIKPTNSPIDNRVLAAAARLQWKEDNNMSLLEAGISPTASELMDTIEAHPGLAEFYPRARRSGMRDIGSAGVLSYFFYRVHREASNLAPSFLDGLEYGGISTANPAHALREEMLKADKVSRRDTLARLMSAWNAFKTWKRKEAVKEGQKDLF